MVLDLFKSRRRARLRAKPAPPAWRAILEHNLPIFNRLSAEDQTELLGHTQVFLAEKHIEGVGGLELTDEIRVTIAGQACLLLLHRETDYYPDLISIVVYPSGYTAREERHIGGGIWEEGGEDRLGHTGRRLGALVLAWDAVRRGAAAPDDGENLVLHEFAHQLDFENQSSDGTPALETHGDYLAWARVMSAEFNALRNAANAGLPTLIDNYGTGDFLKADYDGKLWDGEVTLLNGDEKQVCVKTEVQDFWFETDKLHPIPLNEDELLKMNFTKLDAADGSTKYLKGSFRLETPIKGNFSHFEMWYREDRRHNPDVHFVHQLQNHYLDMTKVHLTREKI